MTQTSASFTSMIWLVVCRMAPQKMATCCAISTEAKAMPEMRARYLPRSPVSIFSATRFMAGPVAVSVEGLLRRLRKTICQRGRGWSVNLDSLTD
jgi:hypothetical protein